MIGFKFIDYEKFTDGEIELAVREKRPADKQRGYVPSYEFDIHLLGKTDTVGRVSLRIGNTRHVKKYAGNIGYEIKQEYRGNRYAAKACNLIKRVAIDHRLKTLWITCNPDNYPSRRTCEILGCKFIEIVDLPEDLDMYKQGDRQKCRYRWNLEEL